MERKLIAIMVGDVVGYSRLVGSNETRTIENLKSCFAFIGECVNDHRGRIFNSAGDSVLAEFGSVLDAVNCAMDIQEFFAEVNEGIVAKGAIKMRFGIHLGDVIVDAESFLGDGINIAARLEPLAEPGGICISDSVHQNLVGRIDTEFEDLGPFELKNIERPIHIFRIPPVGEAKRSQPASAADKLLADSTAPAIAVLPFDNMSGDPEAEHFVDGLTEDLITALAAWRAFPVIARNSTFTYKGRPVDIRSAATELNARYILEGSVRKSRKRVRVNAQLIDAETGHHTWAEKFDREIEEIFDVQDEITRYLAGIVVPEVEKVEQRRLVTSHPSSLKVWELVQRAQMFLNRGTGADNIQARTYFNRALDLDPNCAQALTGMAYTYHRDIWLNFADDRESAIDKVIGNAQSALKIDPNDSMAHCLLGFGYWWSKDFDLAIAEGMRGVELNPSNYVALSQLGLALCFGGRPLESLAQFEQSIRVNPRNPVIHFIYSCLARAQLCARNPEVAAAEASNALSHNANYPLAYLIRASAMGHLDKLDAARRDLEICERKQPGFAVEWASTPMFKNRDEDLHLLAGLRKAGLDACLPLDA